MAKPGYKEPPSPVSLGGAPAGIVSGVSGLGEMLELESPIVDSHTKMDTGFVGLHLTDPKHDEPPWSYHDEVMWRTAGLIFAFSTGGFTGAALGGSSLLTKFLVRSLAGIPGDILPAIIASHGNEPAAQAFGQGQFWGRVGQATLDVLAITPSGEIPAEGISEPVEPLVEPIEGPDLPAEPEGSWWDYVNPMKWGEWMAEAYYGPEHAPIYSPDQPWIPGAGFDQSLFEWLSHQAYGGATPLSPPEGGVPDVGRIPSFWEFAQEITSDFYGTPIGPAYEPGGFYSPLPAPVSPPVSVLPPGHAIEDLDPTFVPFF